MKIQTKINDFIVPSNNGLVSAINQSKLGVLKFESEQGREDKLLGIEKEKEPLIVDHISNFDLEIDEVFEFSGGLEHSKDKDEEMLQQALKKSKKPIKIDKRTKAWKQKVLAEKLQTEKDSKE